MQTLEFSLNTKEWGVIRLLRPVPIKENVWGILLPIRGTEIENLVPVVSGEVFSHALYGHATPLMRLLGPDPKAQLRRASKVYSQCKDRDCCVSKGPNCHPCAKMPDCFRPETENPDQELAVTLVLLTWRNGSYVIVVEGAEFTL
jgi:hypothetical protein